MARLSFIALVMTCFSFEATAFGRKPDFEAMYRCFESAEPDTFHLCVRLIVRSCTARTMKQDTLAFCMREVAWHWDQRATRAMRNAEPTLSEAQRDDLAATSEDIFRDAKRLCDTPGAYAIPLSAFQERIKLDICKALRRSLVGFYLEHGTNLMAGAPAPR